MTLTIKYYGTPQIPYFSRIILNHIKYEIVKQTTKPHSST
jgi:hypothetical protein